LTAGGCTVAVAVDVSVTVVASVTTVMEVSVVSVVSEATTVAVAGSVTVTVSPSPVSVVASRVTVVGWGSRQLQALESFHPGLPSRCFLVRSGQLVGRMAVMVGARLTGVITAVTVAVVVSSSVLVEVVVAVVSVVVTLLGSWLDAHSFRENIISGSLDLHNVRHSVRDSRGLRNRHNLSFRSDGAEIGRHGLDRQVAAAKGNGLLLDTLNTSFGKGAQAGKVLENMRNGADIEERRAGGNSDRGQKCCSAQKGNPG